MDGTLGSRDPSKDGKGTFFNSVGESALLDQGADFVMGTAVSMGMIMMISMVVGMGLAVGV